MFKVITEGFKGFITRVGRERVRREFLLRDDRFLEDIGVSRDLLETGIDAWPWKSVGNAVEIVEPVKANGRGAAAVEGFAKLAAFSRIPSVSTTPDGLCR